MKRQSWIVIGALLLGLPLQAQGKPLTVTGVRGLSFGAALLQTIDKEWRADHPMRVGASKVRRDEAVGHGGSVAHVETGCREHSLDEPAEVPFRYAS